MTAATRDASSYGVVVHLDEAEPGKHAAVLTNIANLLDDLGAAQTAAVDAGEGNAARVDTGPGDANPGDADPALLVELVCHGPGLDLCLTGSPLRTRLEELMVRGVAVAACRNTMRSRSLDEAALTPGVQVVPSGVGELVRKQHQGWAYLRP